MNDSKAYSESFEKGEMKNTDLSPLINPQAKHMCQASTTAKIKSDINENKEIDGGVTDATDENKNDILKAASSILTDLYPKQNWVLLKRQIMKKSAQKQKKLKHTKNLQKTRKRQCTGNFISKINVQIAIIIYNI